MNQREFDADLYTKFDDTGFLMRFPEDSAGYRDNPIRKLFEQDKEVDVEDREL
jgi:hypothetical protein